MNEIAVKQADVGRIGSQDPIRIGNGIYVLIDTDQQSVRKNFFTNFPSVTATADGPVDEYFSRPAIEVIGHFLRHGGDVAIGHKIRVLTRLFRF